ncbi:MAG: acetyl/propionyl/methylcrotonyl-CoA carboxylase subunit alpha [Hylemonella sp.]
MFKKILIANRGEIACRVASSARRMGIKTVAVYSDVDAGAKHVAWCDEAVALGGQTPAESYLRWERIIDAARSSGAQAIHPGYGFLSENEAFARACAQAGLIFVGPPATAIRAMGLKAESKRLMAQANVPLVPGYHGDDQDARLLLHEADRIGYPVLIKASAGGGGKGMRVVSRHEEFEGALAACRREAQNSFANDAVLIEKYVQRPRHIEIQVFGDSLGNFVYLFERDCSVQRRHQKVLEEAPAPGLSEEMRQQMGLAAVEAARAVGYVGAGTVEFIVEQRTSGPGVGASMSFYFMEMNTRLQVEHPVTEAITGLDLVEWQLRVAAGEPLPLRQEQLRRHGHAIEARICAENPDRQFLPAIGNLLAYAMPPCSEFTPSDVRVDSGVRQGDAISPHYDSMVAKLIVHGDTREQALARLDAALAATRIVGLPTNVQFLRHVVQSQSFAKADLDTALIEREAVVLFGQERVGFALAAAAVVADTLSREPLTVGSAWDDPWARRDGWRAFGQATRHFDFEFHDERLTASLSYEHDGSLKLQAGPQQGVLRYSLEGKTLQLDFAEQRQLVQVIRDGEIAHVFTPQGATQIIVLDTLSHAGETMAAAGGLTAPMPGKLVAFLVGPGDQVRQGQVLAVLEAMKMEHTIAAPADGEVAELLYAQGDQVAEGVALLTLKA